MYGDPLLTGRRTFPCRAEELACELRKLDRPLLIQARKDDPDAKGQLIDAAGLDRVAARLAENIHLTRPGPTPEWGNDRFFYLSWKKSPVGVDAV